MDWQIKKRLVRDITVYPYVGSVDGDKSFGTPITLKGYEAPKDTVTFTRDGIVHTIDTVIYFDGSALNSIHLADEIVNSVGKRLPIKNISSWQGLTTYCELVEVII